MNKDIILLNEDSETITIMCEKEDGINSYTVFGMNEYSCYEMITNSDSNFITLDKKNLERFYNIKIDYFYNTGEKEIYLGSTNRYIFKNNYETLNIRTIKSYNGYALAITNDTIYDKYILYKKVKDKYIAIYETEDFVFNTDALNTSDIFYIEGLKKENNIYKTYAKSEDFKCKPIELKRELKIPKISVVIPCYNREKYIARCLDSILLSTLNELEIIIVYDYSDDNSEEVLRWYEANYPDFIKYITNDVNKGLAHARNVGTNMIIGKYTSFIDSDDYIHPRMYERLYDVVNKEKLDICIGKAVIRQDTDNYFITLDIDPKGEMYKIYTYEVMFHNKIKCSNENIFYDAVWNKIIKTDLIKKVKFPITRLYEDLAFTKTIYSYIDKFGFAFYAYYVWDRRDHKIVDTLTGIISKYVGFDIYETHNNAVYYPLQYGNPDRKEELIYDMFKEVYNYIITLNNKSINDPVFGYYIKEMKKVDEKEHVLNNKFIQEDEEFYTFLQKYL